jgi:AraC-like DNA-binding protein
LRQSLVLAMLPATRFHRLRSAEPERYCISACRTWADALEFIRRRPVELAVVDPLLEGRLRTYEIERLRLLFPSLPVLVYTSLTPELGGALLTLGRLGIHRVLFERFDDAPATLRSLLREELAHGAAHVVVQALESHLAPLPEQLRWALETLVHGPAEAATVAALAERAQLTRRTCERYFSRAGLPSPRTLMLLVRALYAHRLLLDPGHTVEDVAIRLGFGKAKALQSCLRDVFGCTAGDLRASLSFDEALSMVTGQYLAPLEQAAS